MGKISQGEMGGGWLCGGGGGGGCFKGLGRERPRGPAQFAAVLRQLPQGCPMMDPGVSGRSNGMPDASPPLREEPFQNSISLAIGFWKMQTGRMI